MFKRLRSRMLLLNLSVLTLLLIAVFTTLYFSTVADINRQIENDIDRLLYSHYSSDIFYIDPPLNSLLDDDFAPEQTVSYVVITDLNNTILETFTQFYVTDNFLIESIAKANGITGKITQDGKVWAYEVRIFSDSKMYAFIDISNEQTVLNGMITKFIVVFALSFVMVSIISSYFTRKFTSPIKEVFEKQKRFISDASHELKTPLTVINTNVDILLNEPNESFDKKWAQYIKSEVTRMDKLTKDLLYLAKMTEIGTETQIQENINASSIIEGIVLSTEALAFEKNITIDYDIQPDIFVEFNEEQFARVIFILIDNAVKYTDQEGSISIELFQKSNHPIFTIRNTGKGIVPDDIKHIFDRFYKADKSRQSLNDSYGLGLSIAAQIMENHQGKITCNSILGEYTEFTIRYK